MNRRIRPLVWIWFLVLTLGLSACGRSESQRLAAAKQYIDKGDRRAAIIELKNILTDVPTSAEARFLLGKTLFLTGDLVGAEIELRRAQSAKFDGDLTIPLLASTLVAKQQYAQVIQEFGRTELQKPTADAELKTQLSLAQMGAGDIDKARQALDAALARIPDYTPALEVRSRLLAATARPAEAMAIADELVNSKPGSAEVWVLRGDLLVKSGGDNVTQAVEAYTKALTIQPRQVDAHAGLIGIYLSKKQFNEAELQWQKLNQVQPSHPQTQFFEALLALHKGNLAVARESAQKLIRWAPDNARLQYLAGQVELTAQAYVQAETHFAKAILLAPKAQPPIRSLSNLYLRTGRPEKALVTITPLLNSTAIDSESLMIAGQAKLMVGDIAAAEAYFVRAQKANPDDLRSTTALALAKLRKGQVDGGLGMLEAITETSADTVADLPLINARMHRREFPEALKAIDRLAAKVPGQPLPDLLRARVFQQRGNPAETRAALEAALAKDPKYLPALLQLGELDIAERRPDAARVRLNAAVKLDPSNAELRVALAEFTSRTGGSKQEVVDLLTQAIKAKPDDASIRGKLVEYALAMGDNALALRTAQASVSALPNDLNALDRLGMAQMASGEVRQAISTFDKLRAMQPAAPLPVLRLVDAHVAVKDFDAAWRHAEQAMVLAPDLLAAYRLAAVVGVRSGRATEAIAIARSLQTRRGMEPEGLQLEGEIHLALKRHDAAAAAFRSALDRNANTEIAQLLHLSLLHSKGESAAAEFAKKWISAHPRDTSFLTGLGVLAQSRRNFSEAEERYRQVLRVQPENIEALNNLAQIFAEQRRPGAVELAERATRLVPNRSPLMDTLAFSYASEGRIKPALELQSQVVANSPDQPIFRLTLAKIQIQAGKRKEARENLTKLAKLGADFAHQAQVQQLLTDLNP